MIRFAAALLFCTMFAGCLNWQASYDSAARSQCDQIVNADERQACHASVARNASEHRS